jgi:ABC-type branched-subunit amino acid transport system substrate-binding protein
VKRLAVLAAVLACAACGTTVPLSQQQPTSGGGPADQALTGQAPVPRANGSSPTVGGGQAVTGAHSGSVLPQGPGTALPSVPPTGSRRSAGPGYSATELRLGFSISSDASGALGSIGLGVTIANQKDLVNTWLARVNREGGVAGRKVVPVFYDYSATGNVQTQDQAACSTWTQDNRVFAASGVRAGASGGGDDLTPCLAKAGVPWLNGNGDAHKWTQYLSSMYSTLSMNRTREERVLVESLAQQGFFTPKAKIGVIINDTSDNMSRAVDEGMVPALRRLGLTISKRFVETLAESQSTNAELQMFAAGVTHVLFAAPGGAAPSFFMQAAQNQGRTYRYGISSQDAPGLTVQSLAPAQQAKNAVGYGYQPGLDVDAHNQPTPTAPMRACFSYYRSKGFDTGSLNQAAMGLICDSVNLLETALRGQVNPTRDSFAAAVARLGTSFGAASTFSTRFSAVQHDGIGSARNLYFDAGCSCFRYRGPIRPVS